MVYIKNFELLTSKDSLQKISDNVQKTIEESGINNGSVVVETIHSSAGILMIDSKASVILDDIVREIRRTIPARVNFYYQEAPENVAGQIKSTLFGSSVSAIVCDGKLLCEGKKDIYFADYDGPQNRTYSVCVTGEKK